MTLDGLQDFKALLSLILLPDDVSTWVRTPNDALDGRTPLAVFFRDGVDAVMPAILREQSVSVGH